MKRKAEKISDREREREAMRIIEDIAANAGIMEPLGSDAFKAFGEIYSHAHVINAPACRKNHPKWTAKIDAAIRASRRRTK